MLFNFWPNQVADVLSQNGTFTQRNTGYPVKYLAGVTTVVDMETGERVRLNKLQSNRNIAVLGPDLKFTNTKNYSVLSSGKKQCFGLTTTLGRNIVGTASQPFLTETGWHGLGQLNPGDWIGVPRTLDVHPQECPSFSDEHLTLLAFLLADGGLAHGSVVFTKGDSLMVEEFKHSLKCAFPSLQANSYMKDHYRVTRKRDARVGNYNPCASWLKSLGVMGCRSEFKFLPKAIFQCSDRQIAFFLSKIFSCDGWFCRRDPVQPRYEIGYCSASFKLAEGINHLLLRLGIISYLRSRIVNGTTYWCIDIRVMEHIKRFVGRIGLTGAKTANIEDFLASRMGACINSSDRIPKSLVVPLIEQQKAEGLKTADITGNPNRRIRFQRYHPTRQLVGDYAENTGCEGLHRLAASDIYWDRVGNIEPLGDQETYQLSVPEYGNFVANDIIAQSSR